MDAPRLAALCARLLPHPWAGIEESTAGLGPEHSFVLALYWESVIKRSMAKRALRRG